MTGNATEINRNIKNLKGLQYNQMNMYCSLLVYIQINVLHAKKLDYEEIHIITSNNISN